MATTGTNQRPTKTQARAARRARQQRRKRLLRYGALIGIGAVSFFFIISLFLPGLPFIGGGGGQGGGGFLGGAPDGPGVRIAEAAPVHIGPGQAHDAYTSVPATSGAHFGQPLAPVRWGIHEEPLEAEEYIHNLEHGGIGIFYDCPDGCDDLVAQLEETASRAVSNGGKVILAPHAGLDNTIALAAWTFLDTFDAYDEDRINDFVNSHDSSPNAPEPNAR